MWLLELLTRALKIRRFRFDSNESYLNNEIAQYLIIIWWLIPIEI